MKLKALLSGVWSCTTQAQLDFFVQRRGPFAVNPYFRQMYVVEKDNTSGLTWIRRYDIKEMQTNERPRPTPPHAHGTP